jgi:hypothetical protein
MMQAPDEALPGWLESDYPRAVAELLGDNLTATARQVRALRDRTPELLHQTALYIMLGLTFEILYIGMAERFHTSSAIGDPLREHVTAPRTTA